jgi:hypothetical protein
VGQAPEGAENFRGAGGEKGGCDGGAPWQAGEEPAAPAAP